MAKGFNIRAWLGLDTKDYEKGLSKAKRQTKQFGDGLKTSMKGATGAATGFLDKMTGGAISGFQGMSQGVKMATKGMGGFKAAMISSGIGTLVVILGSLVTYFSKTQEGQEKMNKLMGGLGAVVDLVMDGLSTLGSFLVGLWDNPKKAIGDFWEMLKTNLINRPKGLLDFWTNTGDALVNIFKYIAAKVKLSLADVPIIGKAIDKDKVKKDAEEAWSGFIEAAEGAARGAIQAVSGLDKDQQNAVVEGAYNVGKSVGKAFANGVQQGTDENVFKNAQNKALIAQKKLKSEISELVRKSDEEDKYTSQQRLAFIEEAKKKNKELYDSQLTMQQEELRLLRNKMAMGPSTIADKEREAELEAGIFDTMAAQESAARELIGRQNTLNKAVKTELETREELIKSMKKEINSGGTELDDQYDFVTPLQEYEDKLKELKAAQAGAWTTDQFLEYQKEIEATQEQIKAFKGEVENLEDTNASVGESFLELGNTIAEAFGISKESFGGFVLSFMNLIPKMITQLNAFSAAEVVKSKKSIAVKQAEAIASGTAEGAKAPWFMAIPVIAGIIGTIASTFSSLPKFENGGILGGNTFTGDKLLFRGNSGEMILNKQQQGSLFKMINQGGAGGGGDVRFEIKGDKLVGVLNNYNNRSKSYG